MRVLCKWASRTGAEGVVLIYSQGSSELPLEFKAEMKKECEFYDAIVKKAHKKRDRFQLVNPKSLAWLTFMPSWERPTDAKMVWYLPENNQAAY